jgi:hypothetical protein
MMVLAQGVEPLTQAVDERGRGLLVRCDAAQLGQEAAD